MKFAHYFKKHGPLFILGALFLFTTELMAQSGWTKRKGEYYVKAYTSFGASDDYYTLSGNKIKTTEFTQLTGGFYGEYGLTDKLTLLSYGPVIKHHYFETTEKITGIGDWAIGAKYGLLSGSIPVSVGLVVDVPLAKADNFAQNKNSSFEQINLPTGDGEWNYMLTLAASHSLYPAPVYISAFSTYNYRTQYNNVDYSDQWRGGLETGVSIANKGWIIATLHVQSSLGDAETVDFVRGEGTEFTSIQLNAIYQITPKIGFSAAIFSYNDLIFDRKNLYSANVLTFGISYELKK